jgi:hypothetical protein
VGDAKEAIVGLTLTSAHYVKAKEILQDRFGRKERLIFEHIQALLHVSCPKVTVKSLWALKNDLDAHVHSLEALGVTGESYGVILTPVILSRLPNEIRMEWARSSEGRESDLVFLLQFLAEEIQRRERSQTYGGNDDARGKSQVQVQQTATATLQGSATALTSECSSAGCGICGKRHSTENCFKLTRASLKRRKGVLRQAKLCFSCLDSGHMNTSCSQVCSRCSGDHHRLLCYSDSTKNGKTEPVGSGECCGDKDCNRHADHQRAGQIEPCEHSF